MSEKLNRCRVVCHMVTSIDGKINGGFEEQEGAEQSGMFYMEQLERYSRCMAIGRATSSELVCDHKADLTVFADAVVPEGDYVVKNPGDRYYISFDRKGSVHWQSNIFSHEEMGETDTPYMFLSVVTEQASKEYLAYLRSIELPYIIAGKEDLDIPLALRKLKEEFGIEQLALCGGGILNGAFFKADMIDELSMVMYPYVQGNAEARSVLEMLGTQHYAKMNATKAQILEDGGVHLVFER